MFICSICVLTFIAEVITHTCLLAKLIYLSCSYTFSKFFGFGSKLLAIELKNNLGNLSFLVFGNVVFWFSSHLYDLRWWFWKRLNFYHCSLMSMRCIHHWYTIYTSFKHYTLFKHDLHTIYTSFQHYFNTIYTLFIHHLKTIYTSFLHYL